VRYFRLVLTYLRIGISNEMQYRANFFIQLLQSFISLGTGLIGLALVYNYTSELAGWTRPELLAVIINAAIQPNMGRLMEEIQDGTLDYALTKPADGQALVSIREFRFWQLVDVVVGLVVLGIAISQIHERVGVGQVVAFVLALMMGAIMSYCFWIILTSIAFWVVRVNEMVNLFQGLYAAGRWPVGIYPNWLRIGLTFLVPVAFAVTVPAEALTGRLSWLTLLGAAGLTLLLVVLARLVWKRGVRNYSGASA
jgi:ABC-2 type transport system permease protein